MSSIYKKGRDGYYYYQAYVHNPETGKKDKRIFHSLGTKDEVLAKEKQIYFDRKYQSITTPKDKKLFPFKKSKNLFKILSFSSLAAIIFALWFNYYNRIPGTNDEPFVNRSDNYKLENSIDNSHIIEPAFNPKSQSDNHIEDIKLYQDTLMYKEISYKDSLDKKINYLPTYRIIRTERLSGSFKQGKVYAIVDSENPDKENLRMLCDSLKKEFSEFTYIVICLYENSNEGIEMAKGNNLKISAKSKKQAWLAMYTSNPVEGVIFNDNPAGYIGAY